LHDKINVNYVIVMSFFMGLSQMQYLIIRIKIYKVCNTKKLRNISINNEISNNNEILHNKILTCYNLTYSIVYPSIRKEPVVLYIDKK